MRNLGREDKAQQQQEQATGSTLIRAADANDDRVCVHIIVARYEKQDEAERADDGQH